MDAHKPLPQTTRRAILSALAGVFSAGALAAVALLVSCATILPTGQQLAPGFESGDGAEGGKICNLDYRRPSFPDTYISNIYIDLTSPHHYVRLEWAGPDAEGQPTGPFRSTPGAGKPTINCNDAEMSNRTGTHCTPKGKFAVVGFSEYMNTAPYCHYITWINIKRGVAMHSHFDLRDTPASNGCIRLDKIPARLIHNNSRVGMTMVHIGGTWTAPDVLIARKKAAEAAAKAEIE